jgi:ATP-binding cassette subfamily F protein 3
VTFQGNYTAYAEKKQQLRDNALKAWMKQQQEIRHQEAVIEKLRSFNREKSIKRAESREKMLEKMDVLEKPVDENTEMKLLLEPDITSSNEVLNIRGLSKAFGQEVLFSGIDLQIRRGERAALIGDNGTGKTTILKIINGMMDADEGTITLGTNVHIGYYEDDKGLNPIASTKIADSITIAKDTTSETYTGTLNNPNALKNGFILVFWDNSVQHKT